MKKLIPLFAFLFGCAIYYTPLTGWETSGFPPRILDFDKFQDDTYSEPCFITDHGLEVRARGGKCPSQKDVEKNTKRILKLAKANPDTIFGYRVVFSNDLVTCNDDYTRGCSSKVMAVVHFYDWRTYMRHELFHKILLEETGDGDRNHFDYRWESFGLLIGQREEF